MELTCEKRRTRWAWLIGTWVVLGALGVVHTLNVRDYLAVVDSVAPVGTVTPPTPLVRLSPTMFADAQTWLRHALAMVETGSWRIRHTEIDNAPFGREVHWSSGFAWLLAGQGWLRQAFTGEPLALAMERAMAWFNLPLLLAVLIGFSVWVARRLGTIAGVLVAVAMMSAADFNSGFAPNQVDHHGILSAANLGVMLGALFMGIGWWRTSAAGSVLLPSSREAARRGAVFSAVWGAIGIWVSAASVLPAIAFIGGAGLLATWWQGRSAARQDAAFDGDVWRWWGRTGAAGCGIFYLLEYAPSHLGWRLEVNHPLYALGWWGGAELVADLSERFLGQRPRRSLWKLAWPLLAIVAPVATILVGGTQVFVIRDPFLQGISARVVEGLALPVAIRSHGWGEIVGVRLPWILAALLPAGGLLLFGRRMDRMLLGFAALTYVAFLSMSFIQIRFFSNAGGAQMVAMLVALVALTQTWAPRWRNLLVLGAAVLMLAPQAANLPEAKAALQKRAVARRDIVQPLYRDLAARLRADRPSGDIVLLTNPDASSGIGYYGRLKTIGTLYWECLAGMKAAAKMSSTTSLAEARELLLARRVTHMVIISEDSFVQEFYEMSHPGAKADEWKQGFAFQLFSGQVAPLWIEQVPYQPPPGLGALPDLRVMMFRTRFGAPAAEEAFQQAQALDQAGRIAEADQAINRALALDDNAPEFWLLKSEILFARQSFKEAFAAVDRCLKQAPLANRAEIATSAGNAFYRNRVHDAAVSLYRYSLTLRYDAMTASNLAWILATSLEPSIRDGQNALALAQRAAAENSNSHVILSSLAAALAEIGQYDQAMTVATRAVELARTAGDAEAIPHAENRLKVYGEGRPWRQ